jgi:hypothetical protein
MSCDIHTGICVMGGASMFDRHVTSISPGPSWSRRRQNWLRGEVVRRTLMRVTPWALHFAKAFFDLQAFWVERGVERADVDRLTAWHDWTSTAALVNSDGWHAIDEAVHNGGPAAVAHRSWLAVRATLGAAQHGCFWYEVEDEGRQVRGCTTFRDIGHCSRRASWQERSRPILDARSDSGSVGAIRQG